MASTTENPQPAKQAIAGVAPAELEEVTIMTVWPTLGATRIGQWLGRLYGNQKGFGPIFTLGRLFALLSIPIVLPVYFATLLPWSARRYRLTNRRVIIERGWRGATVKDVPLDQFDTITIEVQPGQEWYPAGDLVFRSGTIETLRLEGVSRPETFRQTCLKAQRSYVGVRKVAGRV